MGEGRAKGIHLSSIIHHMKVTSEGPYLPIAGEQDGVRMQVGFLWEHAAESMAAGMPLEEAIDLAFKRLMIGTRPQLVNQVKVEKDGVHMTPDSFDPQRGELVSYKATWRSLGKALTQDDFERNFWTWIMQEAGYAHALGVDTATWVVLWVCGDYKGAKSPRCMQATAKWTAEELAENWSIILAHKKALTDQQSGPTL